MRDKANDREGAKKPPFDRDQPSESPGQRGKDDTTDTGRAVAPRSADADKSTDATMPPGQGTDPKRNTL